MPISSDICTLVTRLLSNSFNHSIFIAILYINLLTSKACFILIVQSFVCAILQQTTEFRDREITDKFAHNPRRSTQNVRQQYNVRTVISCSHARLLQDGHENLQDYQDKERHCIVPTVQPCRHCAILSGSCTFRSILAVALQPEDQWSCKRSPDILA